MVKSKFIQAMTTIADAGREMIAPLFGGDASPSLEKLCRELISHKGEALGTALGREVIDSYTALDEAGRLHFFETLRQDFEPDPKRLSEAIAAFQSDPSAENRMVLEKVVKAPRQSLIKAINMAPGGTAALLGMRSDLLRFTKLNPALKVVDADFRHLFEAWFNRGFLSIERISWSTPAVILEQLIKYEAVHEIHGWSDLRRRLDADRRCFAFFHPALPGEPLIFIEVALTRNLASSVQDLLHSEPGADARDADTATFYSISNCQAGLVGISFGNFLIKQVVLELKEELPQITTFSTLSPIPELVNWMRRTPVDDALAALGLPEDMAEGYRQFQSQTPRTVEEAGDGIRPLLMAVCARYLVHAKNKGLPVDPVARFHLGNGARLERINWQGDCSPKGQEQSFCMMVNYLYALDAIEKNHEAYTVDGKIALGKPVKSLL
ncbi:malonyl-CoA decarboxylase [Magnetospira thiophila]